MTNSTYVHTFPLNLLLSPKGEWGGEEEELSCHGAKQRLHSLTKGRNRQEQNSPFLFKLENVDGTNGLPDYSPLHFFT